LLYVIDWATCTYTGAAVGVGVGVGGVGGVGVGIGGVGVGIGGVGVGGVGVEGVGCTTAGAGPVAVEVAIDVIGGSVARAIPAAMVRVLRSAACAVAGTPVVMSKAVVMVHGVAAASAAVATANTTFASCAPVFATVAVNVLVPHPWLVGIAPEASVQLGSTNSIVSDVCSALEHWNVSTAVLADHATGLFMTSDVPEKAATAVAVDTGIGTAITFVALAITAAMVRVARFPFCATAATLVMDEAVVMVQVVAAASVSEPVATVNVTFLLVSSAAAVNVLVPHPRVVGAAVPASVHAGSITTIVSFAASGTEHWNVSATALGAPTMGLSITNDVLKNPTSAPLKMPA